MFGELFLSIFVILVGVLISWFAQPDVPFYVVEGVDEFVALIVLVGSGIFYFILMIREFRVLVSSLFHHFFLSGFSVFGFGFHALLLPFIWFIMLWSGFNVLMISVLNLISDFVSFHLFIRLWVGFFFWNGFWVWFTNWVGWLWIFPLWVVWFDYYVENFILESLPLMNMFLLLRHYVIGWEEVKKSAGHVPWWDDALTWRYLHYIGFKDFIFYIFVFMNWIHCPFLWFSGNEFVGHECGFLCLITALKLKN